MRKLFFLFISAGFFISTHAQSKIGINTNFADAGVAFGNSQTSISASYLHNWYFGKKNNFFIGTGARFTYYSGSNANYTSAPAKFAGDEKLTDTLLLGKASVNALNVVINLGYRFSSKLQAGFNIDAIGFSFGGSRIATFKTNGASAATNAKPTSTNTLLIGNNDKGTLNSQLYLQYYFNSKWAAKAAYQYLFTEYTSDTKIQQQPEANDRFRNKSTMIYAGVTYAF